MRLYAYNMAGKYPGKPRLKTYGPKMDRMSRNEELICCTQDSSFSMSMENRATEKGKLKPGRNVIRP